MELLKLLSANELVAQTVSFLILLALLRIFLWKRFLKILDDRRERIASELKDVEDKKAVIEGLKNEYESKMKGVEDAARRRIEESIEEGKRISGEIREDAQEAAQKVIADSKETIRRELVKAREELHGEIVDITIRAAEKVIEETLTESSDRKIVEDFLKRIDKA